MKQKDVVICDECEERITNTKCCICNKDVCRECGNDLNCCKYEGGLKISLFGKKIEFSEENKLICKSCADKLHQMEHLTDNVRDGVIKMFQELIVEDEI